MKKILLATTVLAFSAGFAAAEVSFSGQAKMGLQYDGGADEETTVHSEAVLYVVMSGETDSGLAFGATIDMIVEDNGDLANDDTTVFISGAFGKLSMGAVPEADENGGLASIGWDDLGGALASDDVAENISGDELGDYLGFDFDGDGDQDLGFGLAHNVNYTYSADAFSVSISGKIGDADVDSYAVGGKYNFGDAYVGIGYAKHEFSGSALVGLTTFDVDSEAEVVTAVAGGTFDAFGLSAMYSDGTITDNIGDDEYDVSAFGVRASYTMEDLTLAAAYSEADMGDFAADQKFYGVSAAYDLGGGAQVVGGIAQVEEGEDYDETIADFGVTMSF